MRLIDWILRTPARIELSRRFGEYSGNEDNWEYRHTKYSPYFFGYNSEKDMGVYLEGNSGIKINQFNEIDEWLDSSKYVNQENANPWPHPLEIDQTRSGNCIGLSLWAWRKLIELGEEVCLVVGERSETQREHAWLMRDTYAGSTLIDTVQSNGRCYSLIDVKDDYAPFFGVESGLKYRIYNGYLGKLRRDYKL